MGPVGSVRIMDMTANSTRKQQYGPMAYIVSAARAILPAPLRRWLNRQQQRLRRWPPGGMVEFGSLRRITPISQSFGLDRGLCIDRYYIEHFLGQYAGDIHGQVLEVGDNLYTVQFGGNRVARSDVLHVMEGNARATIVADLTQADQIPSDVYDCIVLTQTLQFIYDVRKAVQTLYRILKPNGVLLVTLSGINRISRYDMDRWGEYWRFTTLSASRLFEEIFPPSNVTVQGYGNVLAAVACLHGLAVAELNREELDYCDADYDVLIAVRAVKPGDR